jgi:beta-ketoacyl synthase-like protein
LRHCQRNKIQGSGDEIVELKRTNGIDFVSPPHYVAPRGRFPFRQTMGILLTARRVLAQEIPVGPDQLHLTGLRAFQFAKELPRQTTDTALASQPFAAERDGFGATEGADVLILESLEHAEERNAEILAEILVYETSGDAVLIQPPENGEGAYRLTMTGLKDAEPPPDDTWYVSVDRTSTPGGDPIVSVAPETLVGEPANQSPVGSTNSMTEHLVGRVGGWLGNPRPASRVCARDPD